MQKLTCNVLSIIVGFLVIFNLASSLINYLIYSDFNLSRQVIISVPITILVCIFVLRKRNVRNNTKV